MVKRTVAPLRRHLSDYIRGFAGYSHNARTYLISVLLQTLGASIIGTVFGLYMKSAGMRESSFGYVEGAVALAT
ncbi:MAG TPA: hypothetical protein VLA05_07540, partial [Coriobacteriia bacterium]|nr:hypothetical protein [Coriobacteriia bacterium]